MARINVNLNAVQDPRPHEEGMLHVAIAEAEVKDNKEGDGQYINWRLNPVDNENNTPVWLITSLKPQSLFVLKKFAQACGVQWEGDGSIDTDEFIGRELFVKVTQEEYEGDVKNRVGRPFQAA